MGSLGTLYIELAVVAFVALVAMASCVAWKIIMNRRSSRIRASDQGEDVNHQQGL